jgi:hypothetical protein
MNPHWAIPECLPNLESSDDKRSTRNKTKVFFEIKGLPFFETDHRRRATYKRKRITHAPEKANTTFFQEVTY